MLMPSRKLDPTPDSRGPLGTYLWHQRQVLGWSLRQAEDKSNVSNAYINQIELGEIRKPSPGILLRLANAYGAPYQHLMELAGHIAVTESPSTKLRGALPTSTLPDLQLTREEEKEVREFVSWIRMRDRKRQNEEK